MQDARPGHLAIPSMQPHRAAAEWQACVAEFFAARLGRRPRGEALAPAVR